MTDTLDTTTVAATVERQKLPAELATSGFCL
jgi:hypothetical protein